MSVYLHIVTPGEARGPCGALMATLAVYTQKAGIDVTIVNPRGSDLIALRTAGARASIENGATHILWLDSDIIMPQDAAVQLLSHEKPVVVANYVMKTSEYLPVTTRDSERIYSTDKTGLEKVTAVGLGLALTDVKIYHKLRFPWFGHRWFYEGDADPVARGLPKDWDKWPSSFEDSYFSDRIREAGYDIFVDHDLSKQIGHYGGSAYFHDRRVDA